MNQKAEDQRGKMYYESMSTSELQQLLRDDCHGVHELPLDDTLVICEILTTRRKKEGQEPYYSVYAAWLRFQAWLFGSGIIAPVSGNPVPGGGERMDFGKMPVGFAMALARNQDALVEFGKLSEAQRQALVDRAHNAQSESEMYQLVNGLVR